MNEQLGVFRIKLSLNVNVYFTIVSFDLVFGTAQGFSYNIIRFWSVGMYLVENLFSHDQMIFFCIKTILEIKLDWKLYLKM